MNARFGGLQTSPKLRLLPCSVVAIIRQLLRVLLVEVGEVVHKLVEAIGECTNILIHSMKSVVNLPHALAELQKFIIGDIVVPLWLLLWLIGPRVPGASSLLLMLLLPLPSSIVLLMLLIFLFFFASLLGVWLKLSNYVPHLIMGEDPVVSSLK